MAFIPIRVDRTSKPPVGTPLRSDGHWSAMGLVGAWAFNEGAARNDVSKLLGAQSNGPMQINPNGMVFNGSDQYFISPELSLRSDNFTAITGVIPSSYKFYSSTIGSVSAGNSGWALRAQQGDGYVGFTTLGTFDFNTSIPSIAPGTYGVIAASVGGGRVNVYRDGYPHFSAVCSVVSATLPGICIGSDYKYSAGQDFFHGTVCWAAYYERVLTDQQISSLSANPWQIYEPETVWVEVAGGGEFTGTYAATQAAQSQSIASSMGFSGYSVQSQPLQVEIVNALLQFAGGTAQIQAANSAALLAALSFAGSGLQTQGDQGQSLLSSLTFDGSSEQSQLNQAVSAAASLGFSGLAAQSQAQQAQAIYQSLIGITGAVSQSQAAQIASLTASLMFGGSAAQSQKTQIGALAAVLSFSGSADQDQTAQAEALATLLAFGGDIDQEQAIQIEALTAILSAMDITGTVEQVQARQLQAASDFVAQINAILRVTASDPLALIISVRDPLALRVTVQ